MTIFRSGFSKIPPACPDLFESEVNAVSRELGVGLLLFRIELGTNVLMPILMLYVTFSQIPDGFVEEKHIVPQGYKSIGAHTEIIAWLGLLCYTIVY